MSTLRFGARARNIKNAPKINKEYSVAELMKLWEAAQNKVEVLEKKIQALIQQIVHLGGKPPSESDIQKLAQQLAAKQAEEEIKRAEEELKV